MPSRFHGALVAFAFAAGACGARTDLGHEASIAELDAGGAPVCDFASDDLSPSATAPYGACGEGVNTSLPPTDKCHFGGGGTSAFEFVPAADFVVRRIELFTNHGKVALLDSDDCGGPGAALFEGDLDSSGDEADWRGANPDRGIALRAGHKYFVWQGPGDDSHLVCSVANNGLGDGNVLEYTNWTSDPKPPWLGPYKGNLWTARLIGLCP